MSTTKKQASEKLKAKKMSKAQIQQAIIKKKQCDAKALAIVEQLLESTVNPDWLLQNLQFISKSHMEDIIEERSIVKLCGYVLCSKPLTVIICQQYHISTRNNKVYDISKRKKFCSSSCYGAANFLLEQMLESPLWLREKDDIPVFQVLPVNVKHVLGDEIDVAEIKIVKQNIHVDNTECVEESKKDEKEYNESFKVKKTRKNRLSDISNLKKNSIHSSTLLNVETNNINDISRNIHSQGLFSDRTYLSELRLNKENEDCESIKPINCKNNCDDKIQKVDIKLNNLDIEIIKQSENMSHSCKDNIRNKDKDTNINTTCKIDRTQPQLSEMNSIETRINKNRSNRCKKEQLQLTESNIKDNNNGKSIIQTQLNDVNSCQNGDNNKLQFYPDKPYNNQDDNKQLEYQLDKNTEDNCNGNKIQSYLVEECTNNIITSKSDYKPEEKRHNNKSNKTKKCKQKESDGTETHVNFYYLLVMRVEQSVREWITENTLCLLLGGENEKCKLLDSLVQHDRYEQLCKKLNRLQLEDEREDRVILEKNMLKPLPHFSVLQEEGKKMELKVRAFYEGRTTIFEDSKNESGNKNNEDEPVLPLTTSHTPNAIRRRIFLDKLNKILPDLLRALTSNTNCSIVEFTYNNEKYSLIKILISTFNLSAANIVFKAAEWTLVGLLIIKMLSLIDVQMKSLLQTKQATLYISMILMSYKLDSSYLDRLIIEVTNTMDIDKLNNKHKKTDIFCKYIN